MLLLFSTLIKESTFLILYFMYTIYRGWLVFGQFSFDSGLVVFRLQNSRIFCDRNAGDRQYANASRSGASVKTARENGERR